MFALSHFFSLFSSSAIKSVADVFNIRRLVAKILRLSKDQHTADKCWPPKTASEHAACHLSAKSKTKIHCVLQVYTSSSSQGAFNLCIVLWSYNLPGMSTRLERKQGLQKRKNL